MRHNLYHIPPEQGPKIVGIGGGTGLSTLLRGLKLYTRNITAIVTVADDGGSTWVWPLPAISAAACNRWPTASR